MIDKELQRNGSGYEALKGYKKMENRAGEIWTMAMNNTSGMERQFLILADHGSFCTGVMLSDIEKDEHDIRVASRSMMYANSGMISYGFTDRLIDYVKTVPDADMDRILHNVADSLGINHTHVFIPPTDSQPQISFTSEGFSATIPDTEEITRLKAQLEIYKDLYNDLLDSVIVRK